MKITTALAVAAGFLALAACCVRAEGSNAADTPDAVTPLGVGARVPDAEVYDVTGAPVSLQAVLKGRPSILVFFRGAWCPYCMAQLQGLQNLHERLKGLGYQLVAVSPDAAKNHEKAVSERGLGYQLLSDRSMAAIRAFGLAFRVVGGTLEKYRGYGIELQPTPGTEDRILPVPAVYLVSPEGVLEFVHYDPDYRRRLDAHAVVAAAQAASAARAQHGVSAEEFSYRDGETVLKGYMAYPEGLASPVPGVVVFHEWWGLNDYAKRRARQLASLGYVALAADVYGEGVNAGSPQEAGRLAGMFKGDRALMRRRTRAAFEALASHERVDASRTAAIGYCFGGTCAIELARSGAHVAAVVSFHGGLAAGDGVPQEKIRARVLVCHGAADPHVSAAEVSGFVDEMDAAGVDWKMVSYGGAVHSFSNPLSGSDASRGAAYNPLADVRSWEDMKDFMLEVFE